jgi:hypothetical protein
MWRTTFSAALSKDKECCCAIMNCMNEVEAELSWKKVSELL